MRIYPFLFIVFNFFIGDAKLLGQNLNNLTSTFPESWIGKWQGTLEIFKGETVVQRVPMYLDHAETDTVGVYIWALIYGEDLKAGRRNYLLREKNKEMGHWIVDEQNSIFLDSYVLSNKLISHFSVMGTEITSIYTLEGEELIFEIIVNKAEILNKSGATIKDGEEIPEVLNYAVTSYQRAVLKRY